MTPTFATWVGRSLSAFAILVMAGSALMKLAHTHEMVEAWTRLGLGPELMEPIAFLDLACVALYLVPRTAVIGGVLVTGYLGAAFAMHLRVGDTGALPLVLLVLAWLGLALRDDRARKLWAASIGAPGDAPAPDAH